MKSNTSAIVNNFIWELLSRLSSQGISLIVSIVLARILLPGQFGLVAMVQVFMTIANVFVVSGFSTSLIQNKDATNLDFSTIFYCSFFISILLVVILCFTAPLIANFYKEDSLVMIIRIYSLSLLLSSYQSVQQAWVARQMIFKKFFYSTLLSTIISGVIGIVMALMGFGVWALVVQSLVAQVVSILVLRLITKWKLTFEFSFERAKTLMQYGSRILVAELVGTLYNQLRQLCIGKFYTSSDLAFYNRGRQIPDLAYNNISGTLSRILFPAMSNYSDNTMEVKTIMQKSIKICSYLVFFILTSLIIIARPLVVLLLTERWLPCVPYMQMLCISYMFQLVSIANLQALKAIGRSDVYLKLELYKKPVGLLLIIVSVPISVMAMAITVPIYSIYAAYVNMKPNNKYLGYSPKEQIKDLLPASLLSLCMFALVYPISFLGLSNLILLVLQIGACFVFYFIGSRIFNLDAYNFCKSELLKKINR